MPSVNQNDERTSGKCWGDRIRLKAKSTERRNPKMQEVKRERESTPFSLIKGKSSGINSHFCIWWLNLNIQNINLISGRGSRAILVSLALLWFCRFHNSYMWGTPRTVSCLPPDSFSLSHRVCVSLNSESDYEPRSIQLSPEVFPGLSDVPVSARSTFPVSRSKIWLIKMIVQASKYWVRVTRMHIYFRHKIAGMLPFFPLAVYLSLNYTVWFLRQDLGTEQYLGTEIVYSHFSIFFFNIVRICTWR